ncbi:MAG TPA: TRAP transporter large permease subunit, partial [Castellaniella sp.]|nr:TRAP transporter large permease subunit [Castellaniella sp.]
MFISATLFALFLFFGMPVVFVLGLAGASFVVLGTDVPITLVSERIFSGLNSFTIMAIPFFIFAGAVMEGGGLSRRIVDFATALIGWVTGSLYLVSVATATALAAISGSGSADAAAVSSIMQPELKRRRYDTDFAAALIAASSSLAQIIPPSLLLVVVAAVSSQSTGALFIAGVAPGLLAAVGLLGVAYLYARRGGAQYESDTRSFSAAYLARTF